MNIKDLKIILASGSPRRIQMLSDEGCNVQVVKPNCAEDLHAELEPHQAVMALALRKALNVGRQEGLVIAADTVVVHNGRIIGKPKDEEDAFNILSELNGQRHQVVSGVCLLHNLTGFTLVFYDSTDVYFKEYSSDDIRSYIATGEPMDKAGAYAIQGLFAEYVDRMEGAYDNVVGLPLEKIKRVLADR